MNGLKEEFIPALRYRTLTRIYDPVLRWAMREATFKCALIQQARVASQHRVLDIGCGTGTLTLMIKSAHPDADVVGIDADSQALEIARRKAAEHQLKLTFYRRMAFDIFYPSNCFDRVFSSLFLHHLTQKDKLRALREAFRVLQPGGELHLADWGRPRNALTKTGFLFVRMLDGFENTRDNACGLLPEPCTTRGSKTLARQDATSRFLEIFVCTGPYVAEFADTCTW